MLRRLVTPKATNGRAFRPSPVTQQCLVQAPTSSSLTSKPALAFDKPTWMTLLQRPPKMIPVSRHTVATNQRPLPAWTNTAVDLAKPRTFENSSGLLLLHILNTCTKSLSRALAPPNTFAWRHASPFSPKSPMPRPMPLIQRPNVVDTTPKVSASNSLVERWSHASRHLARSMNRLVAFV
ncbi:Aste57867_7353 [Aphanomyces stellatus]|uniref:Aste57867_2842 protein n=1 Tax=Aphanomyces stellatus TaxID=120398 RepID=A0A485KI75_9STRA|nr:hypothetical protein As57867_007327 [Aphanomyces stellatus]KAF0713016.1 hypothetical protein As57867_004545 [Aphanomyces stellatus]KAF0716448.1 hypothetical protein As57867_002834 [Aphanomyces stellatus]VFT80029.1 Aste57867_2842 [Aphanomyces stellatus]VFT81664.1 Aste57867_4558 [Aphanomyces stellatus]